MSGQNRFYTGKFTTVNWKEGINQKTGVKVWCLNFIIPVWYLCVSQEPYTIGHSTPFKSFYYSSLYCSIVGIHCICSFFRFKLSFFEVENVEMFVAWFCRALTNRTGQIRHLLSKIIFLSSCHRWGQVKSTAPISANVNGLSAFCLLVTRWSSYYRAESLLRKVDSRAVDLPGPHICLIFIIAEKL
jgi:hypothetical protein